jgi:hypothetical protein
MKTNYVKNSYLIFNNQKCKVIWRLLRFRLEIVETKFVRH